MSDLKLRLPMSSAFSLRPNHSIKTRFLLSCEIPNKPKLKPMLRVSIPLSKDSLNFVWPRVKMWARMGLSMTKLPLPSPAARIAECPGTSQAMSRTDAITFFSTADGVPEGISERTANAIGRSAFLVALPAESVQRSARDVWASAGFSLCKSSYTREPSAGRKGKRVVDGQRPWF
jgi:hypothetical protein